MISRHGSHWKARPCSFIGSQQPGHRGFIGSSKCLKLGWPDEALLISNNASKLFFQPRILLLKGFDSVLERQHVGRLGAGWTGWRDLLLVKVNHHELILSREPRALGADSSRNEHHDRAPKGPLRESKVTTRDSFDDLPHQL